MCLELALTSYIPCLISASPHSAAASMRVRATMIISYLVIQFSSSSVQSTLLNHACDNLVSRGSGFTSTDTNSGSGTGTGEENVKILLVEIMRHCDSILQILSACSGGGEATVIDDRCIIRVLKATMTAAPRGGCRPHHAQWWLIATISYLARRTVGSPGAGSGA
jgi:hypothetical protein